jgi:spore maturation protein CgeB
VRALPGIPTIRVFEAMACGIPLVSAPWDDTEGLFTPGEDYLVARDGAQMQRHLREVLNDRQLSESLVLHAFRTIHKRHTCAHRVSELLEFIRELAPERSTTANSIAV